MMTKKQLINEVIAYCDDFATIHCPKGFERHYALMYSCLCKASAILKLRCSASMLLSVCKLLNRVQKLKRAMGYYVLYFDYITENFE